MWSNGNSILAEEYTDKLKKRSWCEIFADRNKIDKELMEKYGLLKNMKDLRETYEKKLKEIEDKYSNMSK